MADPDADLVEYTGADKTTKADPRGGPKKVAPVAAPLTEELAAPAPRVAVYTPPKDGESHPKHAILGPALRLDKADADLTSAQLELRAATSHLRSCEAIEAEALLALTKIMPGPTYDEVNRQRLAAEQAAKVARVEQGLAPVAAPVRSHGRSPIDQQAAHRPRHSTVPLFSPVSRHRV
jgi:hypothetical protein